MVGLRLTPGTPVSATQAFRAGRIEIQDEGSQIAALLAASGHPRQVVDLCAGAGGKTLALAAALGNHGQIYAFDRDRRRLGELAKRLKTARVRNVQWRNLLRDGDSPHLRPLKERMDLVLIDVPCSGSGTWRRHPELPWRLTPARLATLIVEQCALLERGAALVKPGGRVAYVTCSLLPAENEAVVEDFLRSHDTFSLLSYEDAWRDGLGTALPETLSRLPEALQLSPGRHGTDGFFIALLERET